jgi:hypothetical protein
MCEEVSGASVLGDVDFGRGRRRAPSASITFRSVYVDACGHSTGQSKAYSIVGINSRMRGP